MAPHCTISGDCRITPFFDCATVIKTIDGYVKDLNDKKFAQLDQRGPCSKYELPDENLVAKLEIEWAGNKTKPAMRGIACSLDSPGFHALVEAVKIVKGDVNPYSIGGSLPLVQDLKEAGFDVQITGFGLSKRYHANNEYCKLSDMKNASRILSYYLTSVNAYAAKHCCPSNSY